jgi:PAS domain S-box-containing protein
LSRVLCLLGGGLVVATTAVALVAPAAYLTSVVQGGLALGAGTALMIAGVVQRNREGAHPSWRPLSWIALFAVVALIELVWTEVVPPLVGGSEPFFDGLTTVAAILSIGCLVTWYDWRRVAEQRRREKNQQSYREIFERVNEPIVLHDADTGEILDANPRAQEVYGYSTEELGELGVGGFSATDEGYDQATAEAKIDEAIETDGTTFDWRIVRPDGTRRWVEVSLKPAVIDGEQRVLGTVRDITEREERTEELRVKNRALAEASVGITIAEADGDRPLEYVNDAFLDQTGYDRADVLGRNCRFLQGPETDPERVAELRRAIEEREPTTVELLNYRADGTPFWNEVTVAPVPDDTGTVTHFVGFQMDVTERKRRERAFSVVNRVLRHNLRNDLTVVRGNARRLSERLDGERSDIAERVVRSADGLVELGKKARELEEVISKETTPRPVDVADIAASVAATLREEYPDAAVRVEMPDEPTVLATTHLEAVLHELGENALEYAGSEVIFRSRRSEDEIAIEVIDEGDGLPEIEKEVLRTGTETQLSHGQGLGLRLVNMMVTDTGGELLIDPDSGAAVVVRLPTPEERRAQPTAVVGRDRN